MLATCKSQLIKKTTLEMIKNTEFVSSITVEMMYLLALAYIWHTWVAVRETNNSKGSEKSSLVDFKSTASRC